MNALNFLREKPQTNWLDYYVNEGRFRQLLEIGTDPMETSTTLASLIPQFIDQAVAVEKELKILIDKQMDQGDINSQQCKSARLWSAAFACCAKMGWNLDTLRQQCNAIQARSLFNRLLYYAYPTIFKETDDMKQIIPVISGLEFGAFLNKDNLFPLWLYCRWILTVDVNGRFTEPPAKPTVSNPANQVDQNLVQADLLKNCVNEIRGFLNEAIGFLEKALSQHQNGLNAPLTDCFLYENHAIVVENMAPSSIFNPVQSALIVPPRPQLNKSTVFLNEKLFTSKTAFDLTCSYFASGKLKAAKSYLLKALSKLPVQSEKNAIYEAIEIPPSLLNGYCQAFGIAVPVTTQVIMAPLTGPLNQKLITELTADNFNGRYSLIFRQLREREIKSNLSETLSIENSIANYLQTNIVNARILDSIGGNSKFVESVHQNLETCPSTSADSYKKLALLNKLCSSSSSIDSKHKSRRTMRKTAPLPPTADEMNGRLNGGAPFWQLLVAFDTNEVKQILPKITPYKAPIRYAISPILGEPVLGKVPANIYDLISVLISKLEQLCRIGDVEGFAVRAEQCVAELGTTLAQQIDVQYRFVLEALRVKLYKWQSLSGRQSGESMVKMTSELVKQINGLIGQLSKLPVFCVEIILPILGLLINTGDWDFRKLDHPKLKSPYVDVAKMISMYAYSSTGSGVDIPTTRAVAESWWKVIAITFEDQGSKRRSDGTSIVNRKEQNLKTLINKKQFFELITMIKEPKILSFILSFLGKLFNVATRGSHRLFIENADLWPQNYDGSYVNMGYLDEMLRSAFKNAMIIEPTNVFWLRMLADYRYAQDRYREAMSTYLEVLIICSDGLSRSWPEDSVIDDVLWYKMSQCCLRLNWNTAAALLTQMMNDPAEHLPDAMRAFELAGQWTNVDPCSALLALIGDVNLAEFANEAFWRAGQSQKAELVVRAIGSQEMNGNNCAEMRQCEAERRKKRLIKILCSHFFNVHW